MFPIIRASTPIYYNNNKGMVTYTETKKTYSITIQQAIHVRSLTSTYQSIASSHRWANLTGKHLQWPRRRKPFQTSDRELPLLTGSWLWTLQDASSGSRDIACVFRVFISSQTHVVTEELTWVFIRLRWPLLFLFLFFPFLSCSGSFEFKFL